MSNRRRARNLGPLPRYLSAVAVAESAPTVEADADLDEAGGNADDLQRYWVSGKGAAKIRWSQAGSMDRCKRALAGKVADPGGLCATYHKVATGKWPSEKKDKNAADDAAQLGRVEVREATTGAATVAPTGRLLVRLIRAGWSANGNLYTAEVLRRAAQERMFAKGTLAYADHATDEEEEARPSGSVKNLAGALTTDARWDEGEQALMAEVKLFAPWREPILDMAESIGMSIRAWVVGGHGEREGRTGFIVEQIVGGRSVDFVTVPAAGGGIVSVLEAVGNEVPVAEARNCGHWFESRIHDGFTDIADRMFGDGYLTRPERIALSAAIGDALSAFAARVEADVPHLYDRDPYAEPDDAEPAMAEESAPTTATAVTEDVTDGTPPSGDETQSEEEPVMTGPQTGSPPVQAGTATVPDGGQPPTPTNPPVPPNDPAPQPTSPAPPAPVEPAQESATAKALTALTEQLATIQQQLATVSARADQRDAENRTLRNEQAARTAVTAAVNGPDVPVQWRAQIAPRVTAAVLGNVPTTATGEVDGTALGEAIKAAVDTEVGYCRAVQAQTLEEAGIGLPTGLGATRETVNDGLDAELKSLFEGSLGLPSAAATIAVKGRG